MFSLTVALVNGFVALRWFRGKRQGSTVPFIGLLTFEVGVAALPIHQLWRWWWIGLPIHWTDLWLIYGLLASRFRQTPKFDADEVK